ncbi:MAG: hypothetical protein ACK559_23325, partial [bacterium]
GGVGPWISSIYCISFLDGSGPQHRQRCSEKTCGSRTGKARESYFGFLMRVVDKKEKVLLVMCVKII